MPTPCFGADYFHTRPTVSQQQSRKLFLAKLLGLGAAALALPRVFVKPAAEKSPGQPAAPASSPFPVAVEARAVARRNDSV
jgi:hypothetical protein